MSFIRIVSLYYCGQIMYFVMEIKTFVVTDVPADITYVLVVTYVAYVLCSIMISLCMSNLGVLTMVKSNIGLHTIVGSNILSSLVRLAHKLLKNMRSG